MTLHLSLKPDGPDFIDLPWQLPLSEWREACSRWVELPMGIARHPIVFVQYGEELYAIKQNVAAACRKEYENLRELQRLNLPAVVPIGHGSLNEGDTQASVITQFLSHSLPYRNLFTQPNLAYYRQFLLDAMAGLLVQLHLNGVFWGDCSLSNTLFRRDAGRLQAYLVDAETTEFHGQLSEAMRQHDLEILAENVFGGLSDLLAGGLLPQHMDPHETVALIEHKYAHLWDKLHRAMEIPVNERFRIREQIERLNQLGFSVEEVEIRGDASGEIIRFKVCVTDRNYFKNRLYGLTGLEAEENQAREFLNEIQECRAGLSQKRPEKVSLQEAAFHWLTRLYQPVVQALYPATQHTDRNEAYHWFLERKWLLSEQAGHDVGRGTALNNLLKSLA